ncbi:MAG: class I SAM-dependent methyltransferase [Candidatus Binatia bacterium]
MAHVRGRKVGANSTEMTGSLHPISNYLRTLAWAIFLPVSVFAITVIINFPYASDKPLGQDQVDQARKYYADAYQKPATSENVSTYETEYKRLGERAAETFQIEKQVRSFVTAYNLKNASVLEIGSGRGSLQNIVENYTGLDISPTVAKYYQKPFVLGSATSLPFEDNSFDAIWSVWVFEHVLNPEQAFAEARRVTRQGGLLFLFPAWNVSSWLAEGYSVRPYSDFDPIGKIIKASISFRSSLAFKAATILPVRVARATFAASGPTKLRYRRLTPNYEQYWTVDSDAVNSIDTYEAILWFTSRGDECLNCGDQPIIFPVVHTPLIIRVNKATENAALPAK